MSAVVPTGNAYDKYASRNPIERRLMEGFFEALTACLPSSPPAQVLEVGVGEGEVARRVRSTYPSSRFTGIDLLDADLVDAWRRESLPASVADVCSLPFESRSADLVLAIEVLEHVEDTTRALDELARVARRDLILSVPREPIWRVANLARGKYVRDLGNTPGHVQHWSSRGFADVIGSRFDIVAVHRPFPWTMIRARSRAA